VIGLTDKVLCGGAIGVPQNPLDSEGDGIIASHRGGRRVAYLVGIQQVDAYLRFEPAHHLAQGLGFQSKQRILPISPNSQPVD
jgi:hypothetical protein